MTESMEDEIMVNRMRRKWEGHRKSLTREQNDAIGVAYLRHIIGVDEEVIEAFVNPSSKATRDLNASHEIGMREAGVWERKENCEAFWNKIQEITQSYNQDELDLLIEKGGVSATFELLYNLDHGKHMDVLHPSNLIRELEINAHAYK